MDPSSMDATTRKYLELTHDYIFFPNRRSTVVVMAVPIMIVSM